MRRISRTISGAKPEARLVEQQQPRLRHQRAAERQHLAFAAGQRLRLLLAALGEARETMIDLLQALFHVGPVAAPAIGAEHQIVDDRHVAEQFASLGHQAEAAFDPLLDIQAPDIDAIIDDFAARARAAPQRRRAAWSCRRRSARSR